MWNSTTGWPLASWRDRLLSAVAERICNPCTDKRKEQYNMNFDNPLECGCRCERVETILAYAEKIDDDIEKYAKDN